MNQKERIDKMEKILNNSTKLLEELEEILLPDVEAAGVLTEDSIYDMMTTSSGLAIQMLELATKMLKR